MPTIQFGFSQIKKETPAIISSLKAGLNYLSGAAVMFLPQVSSTFGVSTDKFAVGLGGFIIFVNFLGVMFGVPAESTTTTQTTKTITTDNKP